MTAQSVSASGRFLWALFAGARVSPLRGFTWLVALCSTRFSSRFPYLYLYSTRLYLYSQHKQPESVTTTGTVIEV